MDKLVVRGTEINVQWDLKRDDFLSLTDIAKIKDSDNPRYIIQNWLPRLDAMAEPTRIRKLHLSLPHGSLWSLSST